MEPCSHFLDLISLLESGIRRLSNTPDCFAGTQSLTSAATKRTKLPTHSPLLLRKALGAWVSLPGLHFIALKQGDMPSTYGLKTLLGKQILREYLHWNKPGGWAPIPPYGLKAHFDSCKDYGLKARSKTFAITARKLLRLLTSKCLRKTLIISFCMSRTTSKIARNILQKVSEETSSRTELEYISCYF